MVKLFIIDDHFLIRDGFIAAFNSENDGVRITGNARKVTEAIDTIRPRRVDIIVLDHDIKNEDPVENLSKLKKEFPGIPVIIISMETSLENKVMMFRKGASAFLINPDDKNNMKAVILQVAAGYFVIPDDVINALDFRNTPLVTDSLSAVEKEVVRLLSCGSSIEIIATQMKKSKSGVEKILENLRQRMNAKNNCELITILLKLTVL